MAVYPVLGEITETYTYSDSAWGDLLTNYNGTAISYDSIGNPTNWIGISSLSWDGRELDSITIANNHTIDYTYNSDGIRTRKYELNNTNQYLYDHTYVLDGSTILKETILYSSAFNGNSTTTLEYYYDESGVASFRYNGTVYHYIKNLQGDVIGIVNSNNGGIVVEYTYDAWGNILSITGELASTVGQINPFRYRGYYYDSETGLYYLNSRYYDPQVGRFINADGIIGANGGLQGYNTFAYCNNNPVAFSDPSGYEISYELGSDVTGAFDIFDDDNGGGGSGYYCTFNAAMYSNLFSGGIYNCGVEFGYTSLGVYSSYFARQNVKAADAIYYENGYARNNANGNTNDNNGTTKNNTKKTTKKCTNPNGRKGGLAHQITIQIARAILEMNGYTVTPEYYVKTPTGAKSYRFVDLYATNGKNDIYIQVGRQNKNGTPVSREEIAIQDIYDATGIQPTFIPYNYPN